ncbi:MAG TPA: hypothetical protein VKA37_06170 [Halobacteriales archaeon]|nr:hypothetical protein [Halobacteriales archaeon]
MRQVRTCDFCGDDAAGLYEPYPPSVPDGPRLLLCDGCRDRLSSIVDPLVAAIEGDAGGDRAEPAPPVREPVSPEPADGGNDTSTGAAGSGDGDPDPGDDAGERSSDVDAAAEADVGESRDASGRSKRERAGTPPGYRKVMRFLENRQLPMDRTEAEQLAADAYEFDEATVSDAIDHAVQYDRLREVRGELRR